MYKCICVNFISNSGGILLLLLLLLIIIIITTTTTATITKATTLLLLFKVCMKECKDSRIVFFDCSVVFSLQLYILRYLHTNYFMVGAFEE